MDYTEASSVDWEEDIYAKGRQINKWPYSEVVSSIMQATAGRNRKEISVLEVGCGAGNNIWFLVSEGFQAHGLDMSATAIEYARRRLLAVGLEADLKVGDMATLPWDDNRFDIVLDRGALTSTTHNHIAMVLEDVRRVLKPGGLLMSFDLFGMNHSERIYGTETSYHAFDNFREGFNSTGLTSFFTREDLKALFSRFHTAQIERKTVHDDNERILSEVYMVKATK